MKLKGRSSGKGSRARRTSQLTVIGGIAIFAFTIVGFIVGAGVAPFLAGGDPSERSARQEEEDRERAAKFVSVVLADTEDVWVDIFRRELGEEYTPSDLVLFRDTTSSPCSGGSAASGPFYCAEDRTAYFDTSFLLSLRRSLSPDGDFAVAYIVAHEVAHHVQNALGILGEANSVRRRVNQTQANLISVRLELQADCYTGVWARHARDRIGAVEPDTVVRVMTAARRISDEMQRRSLGRNTMPHTFVHGTSDQRRTWFQRGYQSASIRMCDTFATNDL